MKLFISAERTYDYSLYIQPSSDNLSYKINWSQEGEEGEDIEYEY